jgi:hypothetical protein
MIGGLLNYETHFAGISQRGRIATQTLAAMLANPQFEPARQDGEEAPDAYARRACDYADALLSEIQRRQVRAGAETTNPQPSTLNSQPT